MLYEVITVLPFLFCNLQVVRQSNYLENEIKRAIVETGSQEQLLQLRINQPDLPRVNIV